MSGFNIESNHDLREDMSPHAMELPDKEDLKSTVDRILEKLPETEAAPRTKDELPSLNDLLSKVRDGTLIEENSQEKLPRSEDFPDVSNLPTPHSILQDVPPNEQQEEIREVGQPIQNKLDGLAREHEVEKDLKEKYPESEGYSIISEAYLRDEDGKIAKDPVTGEARRIDFVVVKGGEVVDSVEVTSKTADKTEQSAKEERIRENGGNYIRDENGNLVKIPSDIHTRIERRD